MTKRTIIQFTTHSIPVAQPRQRHAVRGGFVRNYTPTKHPVNAFKAAVQMAFKEAYDGPVLDGPLSMTCIFVMPRPKSMNRKTKPNPRVWHEKKPDLDNLIKSLKDSLSGLAWRDDSQVCYLHVQKITGAINDTPCVEVIITQKDGYTTIPTK